MPEGDEPGGVQKPRPVPDLGFFAGPARPASQFGGPPVSQFGGPPAPQFGGPPVSQFGGPPPVGAPAWPGTAARPGAGVPAWVVVLVCVTAVLGLLTVAAVAVPVFLSQRVKGQAATTTLSVPATIGDFVKATDPDSVAASEQAVRSTADNPAFTQSVAAVYVSRDGRRRVFVLASHPRRPIEPAQSAQVMAGFAASLQGQAGEPVQLLPREPGKLGGTLGCAVVSVRGTPGTACMAVGPGAAVAIVMPGVVDDAEATNLAHIIRGGVEKHG